MQYRHRSPPGAYANQQTNCLLKRSMLVDKVRHDDLPETQPSGAARPKTGAPQSLMMLSLGSKGKDEPKISRVNLPHKPDSPYEISELPFGLNC